MIATIEDSLQSREEYSQQKKYEWSSIELDVFFFMHTFICRVICRDKQICMVKIAEYVMHTVAYCDKLISPVLPLPSSPGLNQDMQNDNQKSINTQSTTRLLSLLSRSPSVSVRV